MIGKIDILKVKSYADASNNDYPLESCYLHQEYSPLTKLKNHLITLSRQYGLGEVSFVPKNKNDWDSIDSFFIESSSDWSYEQTSKIWDEIIESTVTFAEDEGIISTLNSTSIIVR